MMTRVEVVVLLLATGAATPALAPIGGEADAGLLGSYSPADAPSGRRGEVRHESVTIDGTRVDYTTILPDGYEPSRTFPAVLAFPPGPQDPEMVGFSVENIWATEAQARGVLVFVPEAPDGDLFFQAGDRVFPELLDHLLASYPVETPRFHFAGPSNGGRSAMHVAAEFPERVRSLTVFPGYLPVAGGADDFPPEARVHRLRRLDELCIRMFVGERDAPWREMMEPQAARMLEMGFDVSLTVEEDQGHLPASLVRGNAHRIFEAIEGCS